MLIKLLSLEFKRVQDKSSNQVHWIVCHWLHIRYSLSPSFSVPNTGPLVSIVYKSILEVFVVVRDVGLVYLCLGESLTLSHKRRNSRLENVWKD